MVIPKHGERISKIDAYLNCAENFGFQEYMYQKEIWRCHC